MVRLRGPEYAKNWGTDRLVGRQTRFFSGVEACHKSRRLRRPSQRLHPDGGRLLDQGPGCSSRPGTNTIRFSALRYTSVISVPLVSQDNADAALTLYYDNPEAYDEHIVSVLKEKLPHVLAVFAGRSPTPRPRSEELEIELRNLIDVLPLVGVSVTPTGC